MKNPDRDQIKLATKFFGGIQSVALNAGVDVSNFSKWLKGQNTLSEPKVLSILETLGLPNGEPDETRVHIWTLKNSNFLDLVPALKLYFKPGARIAKAPWAAPGIKTIHRVFKIIPNPSSVYAITDGSIRAILRIPPAPSVLLQNANYKDFLKWRDGTEEGSILELTEDDALWISGEPTVLEFDAVWSDANRPMTMADIEEKMQRTGLAVEDLDKAIDLYLASDRNS